MTLPDVRVEVSFTMDPSTTGMYLWTDITPWVEWAQGVRISRRRSHELDLVTPGTLSLTLDNSDSRFVAGNSGSPYYPYVLINRPIRVRGYHPASVNMLEQFVSTGSGTSGFSVSQGSLAVDFATFPAGHTSSIQWAAGTLASTGQTLRIGSGGLTTPTDQAEPVIDGRTYSAHCQARTTVAVSAQLKIRWYGLNASLISESSGTAVALTTSWQQLSVSATAPAGAMWARIVLTNTTTTASSTQINAGAWQFEHAAAPTSWVLPGEAFGRYLGYVDRWPHAYSRGILGQVTLTATDLMKRLSRHPLYDVGAVVDGQLSGTRVNAILQRINFFAFPISISTDQGVSTVGLSGNEFTQSLLANIRAAEISEGGLFYISGGGTARFYGRDRRLDPSLISEVTLPAGDIGTDFSYMIDDTLLINEATVTGTGSISVTRSDLDSQFSSRYGICNKSVSTLLQSTTDVTDRADFLLLQYAEPRPRSGPITVELANKPELHDDWTVMEIGRLLHLTGLPSGLPSTLDLWVEGISEVWTDETWTMTLDTSPDNGIRSLVLDSSDYGILDTGRLGW